MRFAYMIQAHKNCRQIIRLIDSLADADTDFYIHIDKKYDDLFEELSEAVAGRKNISLIKNRISVNWSSFSQVEATLKLLESVIESAREYNYISLISGQDYPIKSNAEIKEYLRAYNGKEFIEAFGIDGYEWRLNTYNFFSEYRGNRNMHIRIIDKILRVIQKGFVNRKNFKDFNLYKGSNWFTITYDCAEYIHGFISQNREFTNKFKYTACSDEHFFQIIIMNSKYSYNVADENLRYIKWIKGSSNPEIMTMDCLEDILESRMLLARKFDFDRDIDIINKIDEIREQK